MSSKIRQSRAEGDFPQNDWRTGALLQVRTLYIAFCQGLFSAAPPGSYRWAPSVQDTEILISDENPISIDAMSRPAITFTRGPVRSNTLGQDDLLHYNFESGAKKKGVLISGVMNINCLSRNDIESEQLAWVIAEQMWMHRELLMRAGFFEIGRDWVIGAPSPAGSLIDGDTSDQWKATVVSTPFQFSRTSQFTPINRHVVEQLGVTLRTQGHGVHPRGPVDGYNISSTAEGVEPPKQPHPLNPGQQVVVRAAHPLRPGLRPPGMGGRVLPIQQATVEQSSAPVTVVTTTPFKV